MPKIKESGPVNSLLKALNNAKQFECRVLDPDEAEVEAHIFDFVSQKLALSVPKDAKIVSLDGFDGAGKTTLARHLARVLRIPLVSLDDYIPKQQNLFLDILKVDCLAEKINGAIENKKRVIVEGCVVESALEKVGLLPDFRIYIIRTSRMRSASDVELVDEYDVLSGEKPGYELIKEEEERLRKWANLPKKIEGGGAGQLSTLRRELIQYHCSIRPHARANVLVKMIRES